MTPFIAAAEYTEKKVSDGYIRQHRRVRVGRSESTAVDTGLPAQTVDAKRPFVTKRVADSESPTLCEAVSPSRVSSQSSRDS